MVLVSILQSVSLYSKNSGHVNVLYIYLCFFSFLLGFAFPLMWYYATILYFGNYYRRDPRERAGLAASAIAVSSTVDICSHSLSVFPYKVLMLCLTNLFIFIEGKHIYIFSVLTYSG